MTDFEKFKEDFVEEIIEGFKDDKNFIQEEHSIDSLQEYKNVIIIGEWQLHDKLIERYVSIEFIFANKYNEGEPATDEQIISFIEDYGYFYNDQIAYNSHSNIYRDPFGRASVNTIYEKYVKLLEN